MNPHAMRPRPLAQPQPDRVEVREMAPGLLAGDNPRVAFDARDAFEHFFHRRGQRRPAMSRLAVADVQLSGAPVHVVPPEGHDLVPAAAGQQQQTDRRDGGRKHRAVGLCLVEHAAEPAVLPGREEPLAADRFVFVELLRSAPTRPHGFASSLA